MSRYDLLVKNVNLVRPGSDRPNRTDIAVSGQTFAAVTPSIDPAQADKVVDAHGLLGLEYTPFEGFEMTHWVKDVWLRGRQILGNGSLLGEPGGRFIARPTAAA